MSKYPIVTLKVKLRWEIIQNPYQTLPIIKADKRVELAVLWCQCAFLSRIPIAECLDICRLARENSEAVLDFVGNDNRLEAVGWSESLQASGVVQISFDIIADESVLMPAEELERLLLLYGEHWQNQRETTMELRIYDLPVLTGDFEL